MRYPVVRAHSSQAKEFLSHQVMEWLKDQDIKQTFASTYDSRANGVAERCIDLVQTKAIVLRVCDSYYRQLPCTFCLFWCSLLWCSKEMPSSKLLLWDVAGCVSFARKHGHQDFPELSSETFILRLTQEP